MRTVKQLLSKYALIKAYLISLVILKGQSCEPNMSVSDYEVDINAFPPRHIRHLYNAFWAYPGMTAFRNEKMLNYLALRAKCSQLMVTVVNKWWITKWDLMVDLFPHFRKYIFASITMVLPVEFVWTKFPRTKAIFRREGRLPLTVLKFSLL